MDDWIGEEKRFFEHLEINNSDALKHLSAAKLALTELSKAKENFKVLAGFNIPIFEAWETILSTKDEKRINEAIKTHLLNWKAEYSKNSAQRNVINGYLSFAALAACCYAHDHGINITIKSDYIPEFLIRGEFPKLKWPNPEWIK